ncbi:hypothetical protein KC19_VG240500 [Ceratodon purpureus]|uniref:Uncharacterized protein n=1 Tax=Ceratodon purpureus TaxID=3225 RepID=A0A8T0HT44_CERPU|nr:hypothetical protein KC19_VG240500 [Ceratodon purpureus]
MTSKDKKAAFHHLHCTLHLPPPTTNSPQNLLTSFHSTTPPFILNQKSVQNQETYYTKSRTSLLCLQRTFFQYKHKVMKRTSNAIIPCCASQCSKSHVDSCTLSVSSRRLSPKLAHCNWF